MSQNGKIVSLRAWKALNARGYDAGLSAERRQFASDYARITQNIDAGIQPSPEDHARSAGISPDEIDDALATLERSKRMASIGVPLPVRLTECQDGLHSDSVTAEVIEVNFDGHDEF